MTKLSSKNIRNVANNRRKKHPFLRALLRKLFTPWKPILLYAPGDFQNPYQSLLYSGFRAYVTPVKLDKLMRYRKCYISNTVHIHWDEAVIPKSDAGKAEEAKRIIKSFHDTGGKIIWTVHNKMPHEINSDSERTRFLSNRAFMCQYADKIHVHNTYARDYLLNNFNVDNEKITVLPHPSYLEWYCVPLKELQPNVKKHFLLFGNIRAYKGFELVLEAFSKITNKEAVSEFHIAGNGADQVKIDKALASSILLRFTSGYISDDDVEKLFQVADFAIFGFKAILTSGSVLLAISFGVPPIAPAHPAVVDSLPEELHDLLYKPNDVNDFARAIDFALSLDAEQYAKKVEVCKVFAKKTKPSNISNELEKQIFS